MDFLGEIVRHKRVEVQRLKQSVPLAQLREAALARQPAPSFSGALRARTVPVALIAEVKRRSPSVGQICDPFEPHRIAASYQFAGAQAVSVLMDEKFFGGGEAVFKEVRQAVTLPLLYKEFVVDPWQVWHASSLGASAVLLIATILDREELAQLLKCCQEARVEPMLEVHNDVELRKASSLDVPCIGINNRDLTTFAVSLQTTLELAPKVPRTCTLVSESGINSAEDVAQLKAVGVHAVLVGEYLLKQKDIVQGIQNLMKAVWT
ncbi:MAG: indole-3-glycerol phosphate synthase TrpC [Verrucomicrobiota bacterium]